MIIVIRCLILILFLLSWVSSIGEEKKKTLDQRMGKRNGKGEKKTSSLAAKKKPAKKAKKAKKSGFKPASASSSTSSEEVIHHSKTTSRLRQKGLLFKNCKKLWIGDPCLGLVEDQKGQLTCGPRVISDVCAAAVHIYDRKVPRQNPAKQELVNRFGNPENSRFPGMCLEEGFEYIRDEGIGLEKNCKWTGKRKRNTEFIPTPGPRIYIGGFDILEGNFESVCNEINQRPLAATVEMTKCFSNFKRKGEIIYRKHKLPASITTSADSPPPSDDSPSSGDSPSSVPPTLTCATPLGDAPPTLTDATPRSEAPATATLTDATPHSDAPPTLTDATPLGEAPATATLTDATPLGDAPPPLTDATTLGVAAATSTDTTPHATPTLPGAPTPDEKDPTLHFVILVGHGKDPISFGQKEGDGDFYVIQNSQGTEWGKDGYAKIAPNEVFGIFAPRPPYRFEAPL